VLFALRSNRSPSIQQRTRHFDRSCSQSHREQRSGEICFSAHILLHAQPQRCACTCGHRATPGSARSRSDYQLRRAFCSLRLVVRGRGRMDRVSDRVVKDGGKPGGRGALHRVQVWFVEKKLLQQRPVVRVHLEKPLLRIDLTCRCRDAEKFGYGRQAGVRRSPIEIDEGRARIRTIRYRPVVFLWQAQVTFSSEKRIVFCSQDGAEAARAFFASGPTCGEPCATEAAVISAATHHEVRRSVFKRAIIVFVLVSCLRSSLHN
jgi:hypothetical protein